MAEKNTPVIFSAEGLNFSIGIQQILNNAELTVHEGERIGLIGRNGCGKTTFMKLLTQEDLATENGKIAKKKNLRVGYMPQDFELDMNLTVFENIKTGVEYLANLLHEYESLPLESNRHHELEAEINLHNAWHLDNKISQVMQSLKVPDGAMYPEKLSGGEKRRVLLARELVREPDLLLLDEPTNHLDAETIEWIENFMANYRGTCLLVTHDRYFLDRVCTRIIELSNGIFYSYDGNYSDFLEKKAEREYHEEKKVEKREKFLRSELEWVRSNPKARTTRNQGRLKRFYEVSSIQGIQREGEMELIIPPADKLGNKVAEFKNVNLSFGDRCMLKDFSLEFEPGMRLGLVGKNGTGKTTFLKMLTGKLSQDNGLIEVADTVNFNYIDQERSILDDEKSVLEEIGEGYDFVMLGTQKITVWSYLKRFLFTDDRINNKVGQLSGGEKARLVIAKQLKRGGNFIILDEPTNDLDLSTLRVLENALATYNGCVAVVSHDRYFLNRVCTGILAFEENSSPEYGIGNYDYYREMKLKNSVKNNSETETTEEAQPKKERVVSRTRKLSYKEQREYDSMEEKILEIETEIEEIEALFAQPDFYTKHGDRQEELSARLDELRPEQDRLYARWEELEKIKNPD